MFDAIFAPQMLLDELGERAWLQAMLDSERALARAEAAVGVIPAAAAEAIAAACRADRFDSDLIAQQGRGSGNPAEPLVRALRAAVGDEAAGYVHYGATSQDIVDTAAMLVSRRALELVLADVARVTAACAALAESHRATPMVARTLLQQALPTTFGLKAATWLVGVLEAQTLTVDARDRLAVQLGGAAGTLAALGEHGPEVVRRMADDLALEEPVAALAHLARARGGARIGPGDAGGLARQDRARRRAHGPDRGRRAERARRRGPRRILHARAQAQPGRIDARAGLCSQGAGLGRRS